MGNFILPDGSVSCNPLIDAHGRIITYLRLSVTDRCNFRCQYCQPDGPANIIPRSELLTYEEMERLVRLFTSMGVHKVRLTGGEPFTRKGLVSFIDRIKQVQGVRDVAITTNGSLAIDHIQQLEKIGVSAINFSLDTLSSKRFQEITGQDCFHQVFTSILAAIMTTMKVKINVVVLDENTDELNDLAMLARDYPVDVRFIETMLFNGQQQNRQGALNHATIKQYIKDSFPDVVSLLPVDSTTAQSYKVRGFQGTLGVIGGRSRCFCQQCNKVRITPQGTLKTCLYDDGVLDLKMMLRSGDSDRDIEKAIRQAVRVRHEDGATAERKRQTKDGRTMATIGG
jgi:molybdenum cofactor biosynthesis protein A